MAGAGVAGLPQAANTTRAMPVKPIKKANLDISVNWYYEEDDEEMMEAGETYGTMTVIPFKLIGY